MVNNYKDYPDTVLQKLRTLKKLKGFGFTLDESTDLIAMIEESQASCKQVSEKFKVKVSLIDQKIQQLTEIRNLLVSGVDSCLKGCAPAESGNCALLLTQHRV